MKSIRHAAFGVSEHWPPFLLSSGFKDQVISSKRPRHLNIDKKIGIDQNIAIPKPGTKPARKPPDYCKMKAFVSHF